MNVLKSIWQCIKTMFLDGCGMDCEKFNPDDYRKPQRYNTRFNVSNDE